MGALIKIIEGKFLEDLTSLLSKNENQNNAADSYPGQVDALASTLKFHHQTVQDNCKVGNNILFCTLYTRLLNLLNEWSQQQPDEFRSIDGYDILNSVNELVKEYDNARNSLQNGDILVRWVPGETLQRELVETVISQALSTKNQKQLQLKSDTNDENPDKFLQRIGIYHNGKVYEVGNRGTLRGGVLEKPVEKRSHYDCVIRPGKDKREEVGKMAKMAYKYSRSHYYPCDHQDKTAVNSKASSKSQLLNTHSFNLLQDDAKSKRLRSQGFAISRPIVCSHFINAILYAVYGSDLIKKGTVTTATLKKNDFIFRVSPLQMWNEFYQSDGLWKYADARFIGLQHKGYIDYSATMKDLKIME